MKTKKKVLINKVYAVCSLVVLSLVGIIGCSDDVLIENPGGIIAPESFFNNEEDFQTAVVGMYGTVFGAWADLAGITMYAVNSGADDLQMRPDANTDRPFTSFENIASSNARPNNLWKLSYRGVANANEIINNIDNLEEESEELKGSIVGQAKFIRAFSYFNLVRFFGEVPIILTTEDKINALTIGQSSVADVYQLIVDDLKAAEEELPVSFSEAGKATKGAAKALLAKVYLNIAGAPLNEVSNYQLAKDKAAELITGSLAGTYSLESDYLDLWTSANRASTSEWIFAFYGNNFATNQGTKQHQQLRPNEENGWNTAFPEVGFFTEFPEGYRKDVSFHTTFIGTDGDIDWEDSLWASPAIGKFRDGGESACTQEDGACNNVNSWDGENKYPVIRYAEVLLIYAEAAAQADGSPDALAIDAVNWIRRRAAAKDADITAANLAVDLPAGMGQTEFVEAVIAERAWELAFEGNRWHDLIRTGQLIDVISAKFPERPITTNNILLPKPPADVAIIEGLEQNPGY